jgi:hypothetical protein
MKNLFSLLFVVALFTSAAIAQVSPSAGNETCFAAYSSNQIKASALFGNGGDPGAYAFMQVTDPSGGDTLVVAKADSQGIPGSLGIYLEFQANVPYIGHDYAVHLVAVNGIDTAYTPVCVASTEWAPIARPGVNSISLDSISATPLQVIVSYQVYPSGQAMVRTEWGTSLGSYPNQEPSKLVEGVDPVTVHDTITVGSPNTKIFWRVYIESTNPLNGFAFSGLTAEITTASGVMTSAMFLGGVTATKTTSELKINCLPGTNVSGEAFVVRGENSVPLDTSASFITAVYDSTVITFTGLTPCTESSYSLYAGQAGGPFTLQQVITAKTDSLDPITFNVTSVNMSQDSAVVFGNGTTDVVGNYPFTLTGVLYSQGQLVDSVAEVVSPGNFDLEAPWGNLSSGTTYTATYTVVQLCRVVSGSITFTTPADTATTALFTADTSSTKTSISVEYSLDVGNLGDGQAFVQCLLNGVPVDSSAVFASSIDAMHTDVFSGLIPGETYTFNVYAGDVGSGMTLQHTVTVRTKMLMGITGAIDSVQTSSTRALVFSHFETDVLSGYPTTVKQDIYQNGNLVSTVTVTGLYGNIGPQPTPMVTGLSSNTAYSVAITVSNENHLEFFYSSFTTDTASVIPNPIINVSESMDIDWNNKQMLVSLNGLSAMNVNFKITDKTTNVLLNPAFPAVTNGLTGQHQVTVGEYDPGTNLRIVYECYYVNNPLVKVVDSIDVTMQASNNPPEIHINPGNIFQTEAEMSINLQPKGWDSDVSVEWYSYGGNLEMYSFHLGRSDTTLYWLLDQFMPNTESYVNVIMTNDHWGNIKKTYVFYTLPVEDTSTVGVGDVQSKAPLIIDHFGNMQVDISENGNIIVYDLSGRAILKKAVGSGNSMISAPTEFLAGSYYLIMLQVGHETYIKRALIQRQ